MGWPIVKVTSGGIAVTEAPVGLGTPVEEASNGLGTAVTYVTSGGLPVSTGGGSGPDTSIVLTRDVQMYGSSSIEGNQDSSTVTIPRASAAIIDPAYTPVLVSGTKYDLQMTNGKWIRNRGVGGETSAQITARLVAAAGGFGATDFCVLHRGDNGVGGLGTGVVASLLTDAQSMVTAIGARPFVQVTNTRGGRGATGAATGEVIGSRDPSVKVALNKAMDDLWLGKGLDLYEVLLDNYTPADANDTADGDLGFSPRSYMIADGSHMNQKGYTLCAEKVIVPIIDAIEGGTPFLVPRQVFETITPSSPAGGDVVGNIASRAYGSGGTYARAPGDVQTTYAIASDGQITRIGATPAVRDLTPIDYTISKTGRATRTGRTWVGERAKSGESKLVEFDSRCVIVCPTAQLANSNKISIVFRYQGTAGQDAVIQNVLGATNQFLIRRLTTGAMDCVLRNASGTVALSRTSATNLFRAADPARWVALSIDVAGNVGQMVHWSTPAAATTVYNGVLASTAADMRLDTAFAIGHSAAGTTTVPVFASMRMGDLFIARDFIDFTVQANREQFSASDGTPNPTQVASVDGAITTAAAVTVTPSVYLAGNATDWRQTRAKGSQLLAFDHYMRADGERGYLTTVP